MKRTGCTPVYFSTLTYSILVSIFNEGPVHCRRTYICILSGDAYMCILWVRQLMHATIAPLWPFRFRRRRRLSSLAATAFEPTQPSFQEEKVTTAGASTISLIHLSHPSTPGRFHNHPETTAHTGRPTVGTTPYVSYTQHFPHLASST